MTGIEGEGITKRMSDQRLKKILLGVFCLSGFSGLIYESLWSHYLKLFLGHAAYAQTLVLAIFMGGMAMGSWLCSRSSGRLRSLLLAYAAAEAAVGLCALFFHEVFDMLTTLSYTSVMPRLGGQLEVYLYKWMLSALLIFPQSVLLGMTFPFMAAGYIRVYPERPGRAVAVLYFINSLGASIGVLVSGFFLIKTVGLPGTMRLAGIINILLAGSVWLLVKDSSHGALPMERTAPAPLMDGMNWPRLLLATSFLTGAASFIYEVGWIRMLTLVMGSSTHSFELMLSAFILGLSLGGFWIRGRMDDGGDYAGLLAIVQVVMGLFALSTLVFYGSTFDVMRWLMAKLGRTEVGYLLFNLAGNGIALALMLPATFCAGMTLPLITGALLKRGYGEGSIGVVYAANTIGAIAGVFFSIHLGLSWLGLKGLITFGSCLDMITGVVLLYAANRRRYGFAVSAATACIVAVAAVLALVRFDQHKMASGVYRTGQILSPADISVSYQKDGKTSSVSILATHDGFTAITTNGKVDAAINLGPGIASADEVTMALAAVIPMGFNPEAKTVANIGLGSGLTTHTLLGNPRLQKVDTIEIEQSIIDGARLFGKAVNRVYDDPRSRIYVDDAKTFLSSHQGSYDIIVSEPSNPWVSGVSGLFSDEFYRMARLHLSNNGLFVQWIQLYEIDVPLVISVLKAISRNFKDYVIYGTTGLNILVVASPDRQLPEFDPWFFGVPEMSASLRRINIGGTQDIEMRRAGSRALLRGLLETYTIRPNSDYYPVLDQNSARTQYLKANASDMLGLSQAMLPVMAMLEGRRSHAETRVSYSPYYPGSQAAFAAMWLRDKMLTGRDAPGPEIPAEFRARADRFMEALRNCGGEQNYEKWLDDVLGISGMLLPNLSPREATAVLQAGVPDACEGSMTKAQRDWLALLEAVARRDAEKMTSGARLLLEESGRLPRKADLYLLASGMLGCRARGDSAGAATFWDRYHERVFSNAEPPIIFRLLKSGGKG